MYYIKKCAILLLTVLFWTMVPAGATETLETLYVKQGETYSFTNVGEEDTTILTGNGYSRYYDYILYDADGKIVQFDDKSSLDDISLSAGQKLEITAAGSYADVSFSKDTVTSKKEKTPCYEKFILSENVVYSFKNISGVKRTIVTSGRPSYNRIHYALYDENGALSSCDTGENWTSKDVPANYTLKLLGAGDESVLKVSFLKNSFEVKKEKEPFFDTTYISAGESYSFKNITDQTVTLFSQGGYRDWRLYDESGNIAAEKIYDEWGSGGNVKKDIPAGYTIELTLTHSISVNTPHGMFEVEKKKESDLKWVSIVSGETYSFTNKTNVPRDLVADNGGGVDIFKDAAVFDEGGNFVSYEIDGEWKTKTVAPGQTIKLSPRSRSFKIGVFTDEFDYKHENEPAFIRNVIHYGETYSFKNITDTDQKMISDSYAQYEIRDDKGEVVETVDSALLGGIVIKPGYTMYVTNLGTVKCAVLSGAFSIEKVSELEEYDYTDVKYGKTYKITNNTTSRYTFPAEDDGLTHDYASYYSSGKLYNSSCGSAYDISIQAGGYALVTFYVNSSINSSSTITVEEVENPVFNKWFLEAHKKYSFKRLIDDIEGVSIGVPNISVDYNPEYDFPISGSFVSTGGNADCVIETLAFDGMAYSLYGEMELSEATEINYKIAEFKANESGKLINNTSYDYFLDTVGGRLDYVRYNSDGSVNYDRKAGSPLYLPANTYAEFTALGDIKIMYMPEYIECEKITSSPVTYYTIPAGETATVQNTKQTLNTISVLVDTYDYVRYDNDNKIISYTADASNSSSSYTSSFTLEAGEKTAITPFDSDLTIIAPKDSVLVNTRVYPVMHKEIVLPGETLTFTNNQSENVIINCSSDDSISYIIYDADGDIVDNTTDYPSRLIIKPHYKLEISDVQSVSVFSAPFEVLGKDIIVTDFNITKAADSGAVKLYAINVPENANVLVASYTQDNKLIDIKELTSESYGIYSGNISVKDAKIFKAFVWESKTSLIPLCEESANPTITE